MDLYRIQRTAIAIAHEAGRLIREAFPRRVRSFDLKGDVNPVTETDLAAERLILEHLRAAFPDHRILAEEGGGDSWAVPGPPVWLVDPLDGTNNFAHGFPHVAVSLALVADGEPLVGIIYDPLRDETFAAVAGGGATLNGEPIHVSSVARLEDALLATGFPYDRRTRPRQQRGADGALCPAGAGGSAGRGGHAGTWPTSPAGGWTASGKSGWPRGTSRRGPC